MIKWKNREDTKDLPMGPKKIQSTVLSEAELHPRQTKMMAAEFLRHLIKAVPYKIHKVLTDHGIQLTNHEHNKHALTPICFKSVDKPP